MKSLLLACLLVAAISSPAGVFDFIGGLEKSLSSGVTCADSPATCGKGLGQLLTLATAQGEASAFKQLRQTTPTINAQNFLTGLATGLRLDNNTASACYSIFNQLNYNAALIYGMVMGGTAAFDVLGALDAACIVNTVLAYDFSPCNFPGLLQDLESLQFGELVSRYTDSNNMCMLNDGWAAVYYCADDFEQCGFGIGATIRVLIGWGI